MRPFVLEGCVDSLESALHAAQGGATRLELCANLLIGGTTPSPHLFRQIRERSEIAVHVLIRPRFGDFCYTASEFDGMLREVEAFRRLGAEGVVIGILTPDGSLDLERMKPLRAAAGTMSVTLHRAFDLTADPVRALEDAVALGMDTILTSGQKQSAVLGIETLRTLVMQAGGRIDILAGGAVDSGNIPRLHRETGVTSFHMSGKRTVEGGMVFRRKDVSMGLPLMSEYQRWEADPAAFQKAREALRTLSIKE